MDRTPPPPHDPTEPTEPAGPPPPLTREEPEELHEPPAPPRRRWSVVALAALGLALLAGLTAALAGFGSRWGAWHFRSGFQLLEWAAYGAIAAAVVALIAMVLTRGGRGKRGFSVAAVAFLLALAVAYVPWSWLRTARSVPPIHDITTDLENPPEFAAVVPLRTRAPNPVEYGGPEVAVQQRRAYPDIRPLVLDLPRERAFQRALDTAQEMGWEIVAASPSAGRIEATDETFWFGFKDDVVIRLTALNDRTVVDVRSLSRVGGGDAGTNAKRVRGYLKAVQR